MMRDTVSNTCMRWFWCGEDDDWGPNPWAVTGWQLVSSTLRVAYLAGVCHSADRLGNLSPKCLMLFFTKDRTLTFWNGFST